MTDVLSRVVTPPPPSFDKVYTTVSSILDRAGVGRTVVAYIPRDAELRSNSVRAAYQDCHVAIYVGGAWQFQDPNVVTSRDGADLIARDDVVLRIANRMPDATREGNAPMLRWEDVPTDPTDPRSKVTNELAEALFDSANYQAFVAAYDERLAQKGAAVGTNEFDAASF